MSRSFPTVYRPRQNQIEQQAVEILSARIRKLDYIGITDGIIEGTSATAHMLADALRQAVNIQDAAEIGRVILALINDYYRKESESDAEEWADQVEEDEREKYNTAVGARRFA